MAFLTPCLKGKMGNTEYFLATMPARDLVNAVRPASELDEWASMGIEERIQREINIKRVKEEIAPYIAENEDRFFGSILVLIYRGEIEFEQLGQFAKGIPAAYKKSIDNIGFLTIEGGALIILDGQHRHSALEAVLKHNVTGKCSKNVPDDVLSVIFIDHESNSKTRRIFNRINRYAKPTSKGDNIITSEDDIAALLARKLLDKDQPFGIKIDDGDDFVNWKNNTISDRSTKFTTIATLYECIKFFLKFQNYNYDPSRCPTEDDIEEYYEQIATYWDKIIEGIEPYKAVFEQPKILPAMRGPSEQFSLIFKPAAQQALFKAILMSEKDGLTIPEICSRINTMDFSINSPLWQNIIIRPNGTIDAKSSAVDSAAELINYLIAGHQMQKEKVAAIQNKYNKLKGNDQPLPQVK